MGIGLIIDAMEADLPLTHRERYMLVVLAENARDNTRTCWPGVERDSDFVRRSQLGRSGRYEVINALIAKGVVERVDRGRHGSRAQYRITDVVKRPDSPDPSAAVEGPGNRDPEPSKRPENSDPSEAGSVRKTRTLQPDEGSGKPGPSEPAKGPDSPNEGSGFSERRVRILRTKGPENPDPSPHPLTSPQGGVGGTTRTGQQTSLIAEKTLKLPEADQTVYDWLRWNGYPDTTHTEARAVRRLVRDRYGSRTTAGYLKKMASPDGGGFADFVQTHRRQRAAEAEATIRQLENTEPACHHGTPAGATPHPTHGQPLCPLCRNGTPTPDTGDSGDPHAAAAIDAYRRATTGTPLTSTLITVTQQAVALLARGADPDAVAALAARAGATGQTLIHLATQEPAA